MTLTKTYALTFVVIEGKHKQESALPYNPENFISSDV